jgi:exosortase
MEIWFRSRTFAHGLLVLPGCLYLIWFYREGISKPAPESWGWVAVVLPGFGYVTGALLQNFLLQQASVIAMFPCLVYAIWGKTVFRQLLLPLGFLGFALPVGTVLEPWLQDVTTVFVSAGLRLTGVPFNRDGYFLSLSSGIWEVAPDCAGLRYLLPGLALGYLYAAVTYRRPLPRLVFLTLCSLLLILANGVRAYSIILTDHIGLANGTDHRVFSYSIYAVTIVILAWVGRWWSDPWQEPGQPTTQPGHSKERARVLVNAASAVALLMVISSILGSVVIPGQTSRVTAPQTAVRDGQKTATPLDVHAP